MFKAKTLELRITSPLLPPFHSAVPPAKTSVSLRLQNDFSLQIESKMFSVHRYGRRIPLPFRSIPFQFGADMLKALINHMIHGWVR